MRISLLLAPLAILASAAAQSTLVIPQAAANADGNSSTGWPFDLATGRFLYIYDSTHFTNNGVNAPILITSIRFRANGSNATWTGSSANVQMSLSTAPIDYAAISTTWNTNHGADLATVFNGTVPLLAGSSTAGTPGPFHMTVTFATPFLYNPLQGDLVIDTTHTGIVVANTPTLDAVTTAGVANAKRVYSTSNPPAATATAWSGDIANVLEFTYSPAAGLTAAFNSDVTGGATPLTVQFTSQSVTSAPGGITSYAWDFDGDGVTDSTAANPSFTYTTCGNYTVSLTVNDGVYPTSTLVRSNYIRTDEVTANFVGTVIAPLTVQFTDTSTPPATSWAWDFDGDSIIDSSAQNPVWAYPSPTAYNVTLTATRFCKTGSRTSVFVPLQQLSTNLAGNNSIGQPATIFFDAAVSNPLGITISGFDSVSTTLNTAFTCDVYLKPGTYVGSEFNAGAWTKVATATGTSSPVAGTPFLATLPQPLHIPAGVYGVALRYVGVVARYVTQSGPLTYATGDVALTLGASVASALGPFIGPATVNTPRGWSGTIYYSTQNVAGTAGHGFFGPGCAGTVGIATQTCTNRPILGSTLSVNVDGMPFGLGVMVVGASNSTSGLGPLPLDLTFLGMTGCPLRVSLDVTDTLAGVGTSATWTFAVPNNPAIAGTVLYNQPAVLDTANSFGFVMGNAAGWVVGTN